MRLILQDADAVIASLDELHAADRLDAARLVQLASAGLAGTIAGLGILHRTEVPLGRLPSLLLVIGMFGLMLAIVALIRVYGEGRRDVGLGVGNLPSKYVAVLARGGGKERLVLEVLVADKDDIVRRNAQVIWFRRRRRDLGFRILVASGTLVATGAALIAGGAFLA